MSTQAPELLWELGVSPWKENMPGKSTKASFAGVEIQERFFQVAVLTARYTQRDSEDGALGNVP